MSNVGDVGSEVSSLPPASPPPSGRGSSFFVTGGTVPSDAPSYVERKADRDLLNALLHGDYCFVLNSRQMGKSSLSVRTIARLHAANIQTAFVDLTKIGAQNVTAEQWYAGLLAETGRALNLRKEFLLHWKSHLELPPVQRYFTALRDVALAQEPAPRFVIFVDEIDAVRSLSFPADEFFAAIRACYNARTEDAAYHRLTFCLVGSATPADLISDTRMSPFNIGRRIELKDFTNEEAQPLADGIPGGQPVLERVLYWTGGQPYLTQRLCQAVAADEPTGSVSSLANATVDRLCDALFLSKSAQESDDNISFVRNRLLRSEVDLAALLDLYRQIRSRRKVRDDETNPLCSVLRLSGVCRLEGDYLIVRNRIYDRVFDKVWVENHMPDAEKRRQKEAYRRGMLRATALSGAVAVGFAALSFIAFGNAEQARLARANAEASAANERTAKIQAQSSETSARNEALRANREAQRANRKEKEAKAALTLAQRREQEAESAQKDALRLAGERETALGEARSSAEVARRLETAARRAEGEAKAFGRQEREARLRGERVLYDADVALAARRRESEYGSARTIAEILDRQRPRIGTPPFEWRYQWQQLYEASAVTIWGEGILLRGTAILPNEDIATLDMDHQVRLYNGMTGKPRRTVVLKKIIPDISASLLLRSGSVLVGTANGQVVLCDIETGRVLRKYLDNDDPNDTIVSLGTSPQEDRVFANSRKGECWIWERDNPQIVRNQRIGRALFAEAFLVGNGFVWADYNAFYVDGTPSRTGASNPVLHSPRTDAAVSTVAASPQDIIAAGNAYGEVILWDAKTRQVLRVVDAHPAFVRKVAFSTDGKQFATGAADGNIRLWETATGKRLTTLKGHFGVISDICFAADNRTMVSSDTEGVTRRWNLASMGEGSNTLPDPTILQNLGQGQSISDIAASRGSLTAIVCGGELHLMDSRTGKKAVSTNEIPRNATAVALSPDSKYAAVGFDDGQIALLETQTAEIRRKWRTPNIGTRWQENMVSCLTFSPDGRTLAVGFGRRDSFPKDMPYNVQLYDAPTGSNVGVITGFENKATAIAFSPTGKRLVIGSHDMKLRLFQRNTRGTWQEIAATQGRGTIFTVAFAPDDSTLVVGEKEGVLRVFDASTLQFRRSLIGHASDVYDVAFSPDGRTLASGSWDRTIKLWDVQEAREVATLTGHRSFVRALAFTADGCTLISGDYEGDLHFWRAANTAHIAATTAAAQPALARSLILEQRWSESLPLLTAYLKKHPDADRNRQLRAIAAASLGKQKLAAADYTLLAQRTGLPFHYISAAQNVLYAGTPDGEAQYRRLCAEAYARLGGREESGPWRLSWLLAMRPDALPDKTALLKQAELTARGKVDGLTVSLLGIAQYRSGKYKEAIVTLTDSERFGSTQRNILFLALAHYRDGNKKTAYEWAKKYLNQRDYKVDSIAAWESSEGLESAILYRELATVFGKTPLEALRTVSRKGIRLTDTGWQMRIEPNTGAAGILRREASPQKGVRIEVQSLGTKRDQMIVAYGGLDPTPGVRYFLTFRARADQDRSVGVKLQRDTYPFSSIGLAMETIEIGPQWRNYRLPFTVGPNAGAKRNELLFTVGQEIGILWLTDVQIVPDTKEQRGVLR